MDIRTQQMEEQLFHALENTDAEMERRYGDRFDLHPARLPHGKAARREYDGLFAFTAGFSAGYGSEFGPGYALCFRMVTLDTVPDEFREQVENEAIAELKKQLVELLPDRKLDIVKDVNGWKIVGDLSIGTAS